jgi:aminopeptidase N
MRQIFLLLFSVISFAQQTQKVDFKTAYGNITINPTEKKVFGTVRYVFEVKEAIDTIAIDAQNMTFSAIELNGKKAFYNNTGKQLKLIDGYKKGKYNLTFTYEAFPKQTMYFNVDGATKQIWTQGQGKYTSHWFPSFDDVNEKVIFNMNITFDKGYNVIANGVLKAVYPDNDKKIWLYEMQKPMSSYLLALVIGDFSNKTVGSQSGIPLQMFIQPKDTAKFEATYRYSKEIFDFLEKEIGFNYPWKIYKQIPVEDFLYAGMENTTATIFSEDFVIDAIDFNDRNYVNVNAHELAHQWFGDLATAKSGKHHWLQEGFATYYALLAERKIFGDDYFYHQLYRTSLQLRNAAKTDTIPVMHEKASSLSFYQKGAWALHAIREAIGAKAFQKAVKSYLKKHQYASAETDDFLKEVGKVSRFDTSAFKKTWLQDYHFQTEEANVLLQKNKFMQVLFEAQQLRKKTFAENKEAYSKILQSDIFYPVKTEILYQMKFIPFEDKKELLLLALQTGDIKVRQSVAEFTEEIPAEFKASYETLLDDNSYDTREIAFMNLWKNFPQSRSAYLAKAQNWIGGNDKSLRIMFLTFSVLSAKEESPEKSKYYNELVDYTSAKYSSTIRQNAIINVLAINDKDTVVLRNMVNATTHYKWQFSKFGREKIRELLQLEGYKTIFESLIPSLSENEKNQLQKLLKE